MRGRVIAAGQAIVTTFSATVIVNNVAPTATFNVPASVNAGSPINLSLTATDVSTVDRTQLTYAFDCGSGYGAFSSSNSATCPTTTGGLRFVRAKVKDKDRGVSEYTATVTVLNVVQQPVATTLPASNVTPTSAVLNGSIKTFSAAVTVKFQLGLSTGNYTTTITLPGSPPLASTTAVNTALTNLRPNTTYFYRVTATTSAGTVNGAEQSFRTAALVTDFNIVAFQSPAGKPNAITSSSVQGRVAFGGDATITSDLIGSGLTNSHGTRDDLIVVGGNLTFTSSSLVNGNIVYGGTATIKSASIPNGTARKATDPLATAATQTWAAQVAATWAALPANGTVTIVSNVVMNLKGTSTTRNVFTISAAQLAKISSLKDRRASWLGGHSQYQRGHGQYEEYGHLAGRRDQPARGLQLLPGDRAELQLSLATRYGLGAIGRHNLHRRLHERHTAWQVRCGH